MTLPLHERIRRDIEARILSGALGPGDRLPTEQALMATYGCARMTVSKALSTLAAAGLVERRKRAGSFVARPRVHSMILDIPDLPAAVAARGQRYRWQLLDHAVRPVRDGDERERALAGDGLLIEIAGIHVADAAPLAVEHRLVSAAAVPAMVEIDPAAEPPGTSLLRMVPWTEAETRIAAVGADAVTARRLAVARGTPCLSIERWTWRGARQITYVRQTFVGSAYDLYARFGPDVRG